MRKPHEIWVDKNGLPGCCLAGSEGDSFRQLLDQPATKIHEFYASSVLEALTYYHRYVGHGEYRWDFPEIDGREYGE